MNIEKLSVSRKQYWDQCALAYKYKYHLKLESPVESPFYFMYGKIVHKIAEEYVRTGCAGSISEITKDVLYGKIVLEVDQAGNDVFAEKLPPDYQKRLPENLHNLKKFADQVGPGGMLEYKFEYDLDPPNNILLTGFIDRLVQRGDKWFIIDYKTTKKGKFRKTTNTIRKDLQLRAYARVVQKKFGVAPDQIMAALYYVEGGNLIATNFSEASLDSVENELINTFKAIQNIPAEAAIGTTGYHCNRCEWRSICPYF